jgi:alanine racemase
MPNHCLELDRANLLHNLAGPRPLAGLARIMPVVKANYYGAGAAPIARALAGEGLIAFRNAAR